MRFKVTFALALLMLKLASTGSIDNPRRHMDEGPRLRKLPGEKCDSNQGAGRASRALWELIQEIDGDGGISARLGTSVAINADATVVAAGAYLHNSPVADDSGQVCVYERLQDSWSKRGPCIEGIAAGEHSGFSIDLSSDGNKLAVGVPFGGNQFGGTTIPGLIRIYEFNRNRIFRSSHWELVQELTGKNSNDNLGHSVSISSNGDIVAAGTGSGSLENEPYAQIWRQNSEGVYELFGDVNDGDCQTSSTRAPSTPAPTTTIEPPTPTPSQSPTSSSPTPSCATGTFDLSGSAYSFFNADGPGRCKCFLETLFPSLQHQL